MSLRQVEVWPTLRLLSYRINNDKNSVLPQRRSWEDQYASQKMGQPLRSHQVVHHPVVWVWLCGSAVFSAARLLCAQATVAVQGSLIFIYLYCVSEMKLVAGFSCYKFE